MNRKTSNAVFGPMGVLTLSATRMIASSVCLAALFLGVLPASAQTPNVSRDLITEPADFDAFVQQQVRSSQVPGVSVAIVKDGQVVLSRGYGLRDVQRKLSMTENAVQPIGSSAKGFTVDALAALVREGKLAPDKL
jgi:CubicO group peptidase (beta-lactamase class C family)